MKRLLLILALLLPTAVIAQQSQPFHLISAASTNATSIKPAAGQLVGAVCINTTSTVYYLKFYDTAGTPTAGTTTVVLSFPCPANSGAGAGFVIAMPQPATFLNGIGMALVGGIADNDSSNAATGVAIDAFFK